MLAFIGDSDADHGSSDHGGAAYGIQGVGGVVLQGNIEVDTLVCQGAAPFGPVYTITAAEGPTVFGLDGEPASKKIIEMLEDGRKRRAAMAAAATPTGRAEGDAENEGSDPAGAEEQWVADAGGDPTAQAKALGGDAQEEGDWDWELQPEDSLHILAGIALDGQPTRGEIEIQMIPPPQTGDVPDGPNADGPADGSTDGGGLQRGMAS